MTNSPSTNGANARGSNFDALNREVQDTLAERKNDSVFRWMIDKVTSPYHKSDDAFSHLELLANEANDSHLPQGLKPKPAEIEAAIKANQFARVKENDAFSIIDGSVKLAAMFTRGRFGRYMTAGVYGLDEVKLADPSFSDAALGLTKGVLERQVAFRTMAREWNPAVSSFAINTSSRFFDTALSSGTYTDPETDQISYSSFGKGLLQTVERAADPTSVGFDLASSLVAGGLSKAMGRVLTGDKFRSILATGFVSGYSTGMAQEYIRQKQSGETDNERLLLFPLAKAAASSLVMAPAAQREYVREYPWQQAAKVRDMEYKLVAISPSEVSRVRWSRSPVDVAVKPVAQDRSLLPSETVNVANQPVPIDWIEAPLNFARNFVRGTKDDRAQLRYIGRPENTPDAPWTMVTSRAFKPLDRQVTTFSDYWDGPRVARKMRDFAEPISRMLGNGAESGAFQLARGPVLKITRTSSYDDLNDLGASPVDAKLLAKPIVLGKLRDDYYRGFVGYLQEYAKSPVTREVAADMAKNMPKSWLFRDYNTRLSGTGDQMSSAEEQLGVNALGKVVFVDYGARSRPRWLEEK